METSCTIDDVLTHSTMIAAAIGAGELELRVFCTFGEMPLEQLPPDGDAIDYIIQFPTSC